MFNFFKKKEEVLLKTEPTQIEDFNDATEIAKYFHKETGVTFENQMSILKSKLTSFCKQRDVYSFSSLLKEIKTQERLKQELIDYLTTNETFFYREFKQIEELVRLVKQKSSSVQILCAPSATGEEPYSIAVALLEAGVSYKDFHILGIDINSEAIAKANEAIYKERNLRNLSQSVISKYFVKKEEKYYLNQEVKALVTLKVTNLFDNDFSKLGKFDFIFSRNMLIYFDQETKLKARNILESMRKDEEYAVFFGHADLF